METAVEFYSEGTRLRGFLTTPDDNEAQLIPGVVMFHGFGCTAQMDFPEHAARLAKRGYAVLRFDYRHWGGSDGEPRNVLLPWREVEDVRNAMTYMQQQPGVDPDRIGIWGASFGGGISIATGALDSRAKAVVATVPVTNGRRWIQSVNPGFTWLRILSELESDRVARLQTGESEFVAVSEFRTPDPNPSSGAGGWIERHAGILGSRVTDWRSVEAILEFAPDEMAGRIAPRALLIIAAPNDSVTPWEQAQAAYAAARDPKRLVALTPTADHYDGYLDPLLSVVIDEVAAWFDEYLGDSLWLDPERQGAHASTLVREASASPQ